MSESARTRQRDRVRDLLSGADHGVDATEVAERLGMQVTSARFHLNKLVADGHAVTEQLAPEGVGRPRVAYRIAPAAAVDELGGLLLRQLGPTARAREDAAAAAGRVWAHGHCVQSMQTALPDPVIAVRSALADLGLSVTETTADPRAHRLAVACDPLTETAGGLPEIVRGTVRGVAEWALDAIADTVGIGYLVQATTVDDDTVGLRLTERPLH